MLQKIVLNFCEKIVLAIEKNCEGWQPRICKHFEIPRTNYSIRRRSKHFLNEAWKKSLAHHPLIKCCLNLKFDNWILFCNYFTTLQNKQVVNKRYLSKQKFQPNLSYFDCKSFSKKNFYNPKDIIYAWQSQSNVGLREKSGVSSKKEK